MKDNREPLVPIKYILHIVNKGIRLGKSLSTEENKLIDKLYVLKWFKVIYSAANAFYNLLKKHRTKALEEWIREYENTTVAKLKRFVGGIKSDMDAVKNTILLPISKGLSKDLSIS